jgi:hypothetical protein
MLFRRRFSKLIDRQLDLFAEDHAGLLERIAEAREAYERAPREDAEDRFGDYQAWAVDGTDELVRLRDGYASTLDGDVAAEYEAAFNRAVRRRFRELALELEEQKYEDL